MDDRFKGRHRTEERYFTRRRALTFPVMMVLMLQKSVKGMQLVLNEFFEKLKQHPVTSSAFTQARGHLRHTAFIELNQKAVLDTCYGDGDYKRYQGMRLLAIDGSRIHLPDTPAIREVYGTVDHQPGGGHPQPLALASVVYDVLNRVALDARLVKSGTYEVDVAFEQLALLQADDLLLFDRNYADYALLAWLLQQGQHFVGRYRNTSNPIVKAMFAGHGLDSQVITLKASKKVRRKVQALGLPMQITVRLVRLRLPNGEVEVLVTSFMNPDEFPVAELGELYPWRWKEETFYGVLKGRLALENFTGQSVEAVQQDFYATVFITGVESFFIESAQTQLDERSSENQYPQQVNKSVSFNAIKNHVLDLFYYENDENVILEQLTALFMMKPTTVRAGRVVPRHKSPARRLLAFQRQRKKITF
jgi:hypothetical protein